MRLRNDPNARAAVAGSRYFADAGGTGPIDPNALFCRAGAKTMLEIGSGKGGFLWEISRTRPNDNFVGLEKQLTVIAKAIGRYERSGTDAANLVVVHGDAARLGEIFLPGAFDGIYLNFSDPWPKKRHAKRRLVHAGFLDAYARILKPGGTIEFKTDNGQLFAYCLEQIALRGATVLAQTGDLHGLDPADPLRAGNVVTEYERKFVAQNKKIGKIVFCFGAR